MNHKIPAMTLIEVLCAVAVLAVALTAASLGYFGVRRFRAERQIYGIKSQLSDLRREAMVRRATCAIRFYESYYVLDRTDEEETVAYEPPLALADYETANGSATISFSPSGRPSNSGHIVLSVEETKYGLIVSPVNAGIRVEKRREK